MSIEQYFGKMWSLLGTITNPSYFTYRLFHYLNKDVPYKIAKRIYLKNLKEYKAFQFNEFLLETFDGSGQAVHPDIAYFENQYWLTVTPYPYGMEEYENPCIYQGDDLKNLRCPQSPIAVQHKHIQGIHLSDPCFAVKDNNIFCYYRESERKENTEENTIWSLQFSRSERKWGKPVLLLDSVDDKILSPAMIHNDEGELIIYFVSTLNNKYTLVSTKSSGVINDLTEYVIEGMPEGYDLWHIGIKKIRDIYKTNNDSNGLVGLFLMKSTYEIGRMKLFEASNNGVETIWHITKEVEMPIEIREVIKFPYKSCYIPQGEGSILLSFRDMKNRNRLCIIKNCIN